MKVRNVKTGEVREVKVPGMAALERMAEAEAVACAGPCRCRVEPDGVCANGWESKLRAFGFI